MLFLSFLLHAACATPANKQEPALQVPPCPLVQNLQPAFDQYAGRFPCLLTFNIIIVTCWHLFPQKMLIAFFHIFLLCPWHHLDFPSFDLGITLSPAKPAVQNFEQHNLPIQKPLPANQTADDRHSSNTSVLSPKAATLQYANNLLYDQMALLDEGSSQQDEVLYGQLVKRGSFDKQTVPHQLPNKPLTFSAQRHPRPEPDIQNMLSLVLQNDTSIDYNR